MKANDLVPRSHALVLLFSLFALSSGLVAQDDLAALRKSFEHPLPGVRLAAAKAVAEHGEKALPMLEAALRDESALVRRAATDAVIALGAKATPLLQALLVRLVDEAAWVRAGAAEALGHTGSLSDDKAVKLVALASDPDLFVRVSAMQTLSKRGVTKNKKLLLQAAIATLEVEESGWAGKRFAIEVLRRHGREHRPAIPALLGVLRMAPEGMWDGTEQVVRLLMGLGKQKEAIELLGARLDRPEAGGVKSCLRVVGKLGKPALPLRPRVEALSRNAGDRDQRKTAKQTLEQLDAAAKGR